MTKNSKTNHDIIHSPSVQLFQAIGYLLHSTVLQSVCFLMQPVRQESLRPHSFHNSILPYLNLVEYQTLAQNGHR